MRVNIIGAGLAGCAAAYIFKQAGYEPVIYEAASSVASGASGNDVGLYNPRISAHYDAIGAFYSTAFKDALAQFAAFGDAIDWDPCGALHLMNTEKKKIRFEKTMKNWGWGEDDMSIVDASEASRLSGVGIASDCLYLSKSGKISPNKLCQEYAKGIEVRLNTEIHNIEALPKGITIIACGLGSMTFPLAGSLPLQSVRGQVSYVEESPYSAHLKTALCYGGYMAPSSNGMHCIGATFQRGSTDISVSEEDDLTNIEKLTSSIQSLDFKYKNVRSRASFRIASRDYFPVVGQLSDGVYISAAHGSHGIVSSLLSAKILLNFVSGTASCVSDDVLKALNPMRFKE